jgi:hypothetical protein
VVDALYRRATTDCQAISVVVPQWLLDVQASYTLDSDAQSLLAKLSLDPNVVPNYTLQNGLLKYKGRIWVGSDDQLKHRILLALHYSPVVGHSGILVTNCRVKQLFAWSRLKQCVQDFVKYVYKQSLTGQHIRANFSPCRFPQQIGTLFL